ncbi:large-conductance mechanosensitive channel protein MscL [Salinimicrobium soli]|uniref:large-conductance mechanosensitive channel protein MscL n=1 Tax=Salinimicrobium soli TaxID=1254399 RepID=UPI003AB0DBE8
MGLIKEFKEFAIKGNMIDMAIGIIIGTAFNKVVDVLVKQVIMPPLAMITNGVNFSEKQIILRETVLDASGAVETEAVVLGYGLFIEVMIDFLIIGFTVFLVVKFMNRFRRKAEDPNNKTVAPAKNVELLENINKLMEEQNELLRSRK